jgi:hypothetical protein
MKKSPNAKKKTGSTHVRPSIGDPDQIQEFPPVSDLPDLDNETVHKTERPVGAILEDDDRDDQLADERNEEREEDVTANKPLRVDH